MGLATKLKQHIEKVTGTTATGASANSAGSLAEQMAYIVANPSAPDFQSAYGFPGSSPSQSAYPFIGAWIGGMSINLSSSAPGYPAGGFTTAASWVAVRDTSARLAYYRNTAGTSVSLIPLNNTTGGFVPIGPSYVDPRIFDLSGMATAKTRLPPSRTYNQVTYEFEFTFTAAVAAATTTGIGASNTSNFAATTRSLSFYRKSGGAGWTFRTTDGTTSSETSEASDTSDGNKHIARIEWDVSTGTPTARLYIDDVLKVTKTTNIPAEQDTVVPDHLLFAADTALASDTLRYYGWATSWKAN